MSDLIRRQDAIDAIHKEFDEVCAWDESGQTTANEVENILYEVPSVEPEPKWIPVTEALPEDSETVIITHKGGVSFGWYNGIYWERGASTKHKPLQTVIAWMPLPEPWRGE